MISPGAVIASVLPVYLLLIVGAILRRTGVIKCESDEPIMRLVFSVLMPCFMLDKILGNSVLRSGSVVLWAIVIGFGFIVFGILIGLLVGKCIGLEKGSGMRTFAISAGCQNFGFAAAPVVEILWGSAALGLLFVHNTGVEIAIWTIAVMLMSGDRRISWRKLLNGPIIAVALGLILVFLNLDHWVVGAPRNAISMIGAGAFPIAILMTGCLMMDLIHTEKPCWKIIIGSAAVRLALVPFAILAAAKFFPLTTELRQVLVVQAAMPAGFTSILMARLFGGRAGVAVQVVIATTILSFLTLPWIITWGCEWIGLKPLLP